MKALLSNRVLLFIVFSMCVFGTFYACRKIDVMKSHQSEKYFETPGGTAPVVTRIANYMKEQNRLQNFLPALAQKEGFALWDKVSIRVNKKISSKNNESGDTLVMIPLVLANKNYVNSFLAVMVNDTITVKLHRGRDYDTYPFANNQPGISADLVASQVMVLDKIAFGYDEFKITDKRLFDFNTRSLDSNGYFVKLKAPGSNKTGRDQDDWDGSWDIGCWPIYIWYDPDGDADPCDCSGNEYYVGVMWEGYNCPAGGGGGSGSGGNGGGVTGGGNPGIWTGGGGGVYTGGDPLGDAQNPLGAGTGLGWVPKEKEPPFNPYIADSVAIDTSITNNYPCFQKIIDTLSMFGNLNQKTQVALSQVFGVNKRIHATIKLERALIGSGTDARTVNTGNSAIGASYDTLDFNCTIFVNPDLLDLASKEYIASTIIHEAMHAYITYVYTLYHLSYITDSNLIKSTFPIFWGPKGFTDQEIQHHNLIALNWIQHLKAPLYAFTNNEMTPLMKDSIYNSLCWGGLRETDVWKKKTDTCDIMAINAAARRKTLGTPFSLNGAPTCTGSYNHTFANLKLKNLCD